MTQARGFVDSTIGRKVIMAVTGAILFGFVLVHMVGNLQVYLWLVLIGSVACLAWGLRYV